jgi:hypothetical protein
MPHPWVYGATIIPDGKIRFSVEVTGLQTTEGAIEITGAATQVNGAFAPISYITDIAAAYKGDPNDPEQEDRYFVDVEAVPTSGQTFDRTLDVTVFVRVSKVWVTVLGSVPQPATGPGVTAWKYKYDAQISAT